MSSPLRADMGGADRAPVYRLYRRRFVGLFVLVSNYSDPVPRDINNTHSGSFEHFGRICCPVVRSYCQRWYVSFSPVSKTTDPFATLSKSPETLDSRSTRSIGSTTSSVWSTSPSRSSSPSSTRGTASARQCVHSSFPPVHARAKTCMFVTVLRGSGAFDHLRLGAVRRHGEELLQERVSVSHHARPGKSLLHACILRIFYDTYAKLTNDVLSRSLQAYPSLYSKSSGLYILKHGSTCKGEQRQL